MDTGGSPVSAPAWTTRLFISRNWNIGTSRWYRRAACTYNVAMSKRGDQLELYCPACGWSERCDLAQMRASLQRIGKLRRAADPEPALVVELFRQAASHFTCPECDAALAVRAVDDADWGAMPKCEGCDQPIPAARLAAMPGATLCAACQQKVDRGEAVGPAEYCPHCGGVMVLRRTTKGIRRYVERCSACGR